MMFGPKQLKAFGISISDSAVKIIQLANHKGGYFPSSFASVDIPATLIANHSIVDEHKLADYITRALKQAQNINTKYVIASVPEAKSFVRVLKMPKMDESEIAGAIPWELEQDIPIPIDQVYLDWQMVKQEGEFNYVLVTATPKDYVDTLLTSLRLAKLKPVALELESQAVARALVGLENGNDSSLVIDLSTNITSFVIVTSAGIVEYTSNIPVGGANLTESISKNLGIPIKDAEKIKLEKGLFSDSKKGNANQAMLPILDNIVDEIRNVIKFHEDHSVLKQKVSKVILCGGGANLQGLVDYVSARLDIGADRPVERIILGDPWLNVMSKEEQAKLEITPPQALAYATAIGLALRGINP